MRQARGLAAAPDFLGRCETAHPRIVDAIVADVVTAAVGNGQLKFSVVPTQDLLQIQVRAQAELVAVARRTIMVIAAVQVGADFAYVVEGKGVTLLFQFTTGTAPIAEHPFGVGVKSGGRLHASSQAQSGNAADQSQSFLPGNRKQRAVFAHIQECGHRSRCESL